MNEYLLMCMFLGTFLIALLTLEDGFRDFLAKTLILMALLFTIVSIGICIANGYNGEQSVAYLAKPYVEMWTWISHL